MPQPSGAPPQVCNAPFHPDPHGGDWKVTGLASLVVACAVLPGDAQHAGWPPSPPTGGHGLGMTPGL